MRIIDECLGVTKYAILYIMWSHFFLESEHSFIYDATLCPSDSWEGDRIT